MDSIFDALLLFRAVHFAAVFLLFGGALFFAYAPRDGAEASSTTSTWRFFLRAIAIAAPVALATGAGWLAATIVNMTGLDGLGDPETLRAFFFETSFGPIEATRIALLVVVTILAFAPMREEARVAALAIASGLLLVSQAWLGHAAEGGATLFGALMIAVYGAHVLAGAAWLGGLPLLLARIVELRRRPAPGAPILHLLSRFSLMATLAVGLVLASGVANAAFRVQGHFGAFVATRYGGVLLAKLLLIGLMLAFAAYNRFVLMARLRTRGRCEPIVIARTAASVVCEVLLGVLVLIAAAVLGITPPPAR